MKDAEIKLKVKTEGFEDAQEQVEALADACGGFPAQITIRNCRDCTFNIYPSQTKIISIGEEEETYEED